jgi:hypothetical protein
MPPREANILPWEEVALDLIGPWRVKIADESYEFYALTCIDTVTNFPDAICLRDKTASHIGMQFEILWLARYPRPVCCLHDRGTEFIGADFQRVLQCFGIKPSAFKTHKPMPCAKDCINPSAMCYVFLSQAIPLNVHNIAELVDSTLATALHAS